MVSNNTIKMLLVLSFMIFGNGAINVQKLKNIKYFNKSELIAFPFNRTFICSTIYEANKDLKKIRQIELNYDMSILFKEDGYIEATNFGTSNKYGQTGIIYLKKGKIKVDVITLLSDRSHAIRTYNLKIIGGNIHLIEDRWIGGDNLSYLIFKTDNNF